MLKQDTDFFAYEDNFKKKEGISSICVYENRADDSLVTIGIPTYKRASTLKESIDSAITQCCNFNYDIIVVDNNPERNDETEILMKDYASNLHISYYKNTQNLGMGGNWNRIAELSKTTWVVFLHDDDLLAPSFLADMIKVATQYQADVVNSAFKLWYEKKGNKPELVFKKKAYQIIRSTLEANFFTNRAGMPTGILCKREVYIKEGGVKDDYYPSIDWIYSSRLSSKYRFLLYEKELTIYRYSLNAMRKKETLEAYLPVNYLFTHYVGNILRYPRRFVNVFARLLTRFTVAQIGKEKYSLYGREFKPISLVERYLYLLIIYIASIYFNRKNLLGTI